MTFWWWTWMGRFMNVCIILDRWHIWRIYQMANIWFNVPIRLSCDPTKSSTFVCGTIHNLLIIGDINYSLFWEWGTWLSTNKSERAFIFQQNIHNMVILQFAKICVVLGVRKANTISCIRECSFSPITFFEEVDLSTKLLEGSKSPPLSVNKL